MLGSLIHSQGSRQGGHGLPPPRQPVRSIQRHLALAGTGLTPATFDALIAPAPHLPRAQGRSFMRPWRTNLLALAGLLAASVAGAQEATPSPSPAPSDDP